MSLGKRTREFNVLPLPEKRGLSREQAAEYIGVSPSLFDQMVADGRMPPPREINARVIWDRREVDEAFGTLPHRGGGPAAQPERRDAWSDLAV
jgi:predicted DNA-binding transcriptional regulator AlpA